MEGRGVSSCCPVVPGFLINSAIAADNGRILHNSFVLPNEQDDVVSGQREILLRNNSDHAVHIPSDQEAPESSDEKASASEDGSRSQGKKCRCGLRLPGMPCVGKFGGRIIHCIVFDPLLAKRIFLMVILAIIITTMTVLSWYFSTTHAARSVDTVADALRNDLLARTQTTTNTLLQNNNASSSALARLLSSPLIPGNYSSFTTLEEQVRPILFSAYSAIPQKRLVSFFGKNGLFIAYSSEFANASLVFANSTYLQPPGGAASEVPWSTGENIAVTRPWYHWYQQSADISTGLPVGEINSIQPIPYWAKDVFNNTWSSREGDSWGVLSTGNNDLSILSVSLVKQSSNSNTVGVAGVGVSVSEIHRSLDDINLQGGDMYITTVDGRLLAQTRIPVSYKMGDIGTPLLPNASASQNLVVAGAAQYLASVQYDAILEYQASNIKIGGRHYALSSSPIEISQTTLVSVVVIPRDSLWGRSDKTSRIVLALLLTLAVSVGIVGCFFMILLAKGVSTEMRLRAALIRQLEATKQAENKSSHKSIVFASMSHDLRTPLAAILGLIDLSLCDAMESSELESNLSQMKSCATNLLGILNSILDMSKIEAGKLQLEESEFDLLEVLEEAVEMFAVVGMKKGLEVVLDLPDDSIEKFPRVLGDAGRVKQLLSNLLSNGVKFTSSGYVVLRAWQKPSIQADKGNDQEKSGALCGCFASWWPRCVSEQSNSQKDVEAEDGYAGVALAEYEFEVDDTGKGIPRDRRKAVFENFVQVDNSIPRTHGGTGLGLGIVRSLVRLMGGDINIIDKDKPGEPGARFRFNILLQVHQEAAMINADTGYPLESDAKIKNSGGISGRHVSTGFSGRNARSISSLEKPVILHPLENPPYRYGPLPSGGVHVLLAMQGQAGKKAAKEWMERRGLQVWTVSHHEDLLPTLEKIKFEVFYEESFSWSDCFEVPPGSQAFDSWVPDDTIQQPAGELSAPPSMYIKKMYSEKVGPRLLLIIDTVMFPNTLEGLTARLHNSLTQGDLFALSRVVWLVTPNTPSTILQSLKQGAVPNDLMLHKPLNVSRLRIIWEQVHFLLQNRELGSSSNKPSPSFTVSPGGSALGDFQGLVPPASPMQDGASTRDRKDSLSESWRTGSTGMDQFLGKHGGADSSSVLVAGGVDTVGESGNLEAEALGHIPGSPSPDVGPFPRIRSRETDIMGPPNSLKGMHILVAEDNSVLQRLTKTTLVRLGASVECVDNGLEAAQVVLANLPRKASSRSSSFGSFRRLKGLARDQVEEESPPVKRRPFDMVLMDCQMPILDGYGATQRIREQEKLLGWRTPVIALTAHAMAKDESKCIEAGMDFYLTKPLATKALLNVVAKINAHAGR